jgi:hypothetical protein
MVANRAAVRRYGEQNPAYEPAHPHPGNGAKIPFVSGGRAWIMSVVEGDHRAVASSCPMARLSPLQGLVIEAYGCGNAGCLRDGGWRCCRRAPVPGFDMTSEAALTKLSVLLGQGIDAATVAQTMQRDVAGALIPKG